MKFLKSIPFLSLICLLLFSCEYSKKATEEDNTNSPLSEQSTEKKEVDIFIYNVFESDSIRIDVKNDHFNFFILLAIGNYRAEYDLTAMNIPTKTPSDISWANNEYACMMTWWSQSQSRHIFIPTNVTNEFIYFDKVLVETDSTNNNIVYIDSVYSERDIVVFKVENLLSRKSKTVQVAINEENGIYPFFDKVELTKDKVTFTTATETKSIAIHEIYRRSDKGD